MEVHQCGLVNNINLYQCSDKLSKLSNSTKIKQETYRNTHSQPWIILRIWVLNLPKIHHRGAPVFMGMECSNTNPKIRISSTIKILHLPRIHTTKPKPVVVETAWSHLRNKYPDLHFWNSWKIKPMKVDLIIGIISLSHILNIIEYSRCRLVNRYREMIKIIWLIWPMSMLMHQPFLKRQKVQEIMWVLTNNSHAQSLTTNAP